MQLHECTFQFGRAVWRVGSFHENTTKYTKSFDFLLQFPTFLVIPASYLLEQIVSLGQKQFERIGAPIQ